MPYVGRFAPSPTGPLHAGSLVAALASWLDARANAGRWLVRIDDLDRSRCVAGAERRILGQLAALGLSPDEPPTRQSQRSDAYQRALDRLQRQGNVYSCGCSRSRIAAYWLARGSTPVRGEEWPYPGTCRDGQQGTAPAALRARTTHEPIEWVDRLLGMQRQDVARTVGDFVVRRADGSATYQLATVVDDAEQAVSDVVRGEDLADNTPRQLHLQSLLGFRSPAYLHTPLVVDAEGEKLSKQQGAPALDTDDPLAALRTAGRSLHLLHAASSSAEWLARAVAEWPRACRSMSAGRDSKVGSIAPSQPARRPP